MKISTLRIAAVVSVCLPLIGLGEEAAPSEALKTSQAQVDIYVAAFNKGDAKGVASAFAEDTRYVPDDGVAIVGRAEMQTRLEAYFKKNKGVKLALAIESARFLTPDVLIENGVATLGDEMTRYTSTYVKKDGNWLIAELDESEIPASDEAADALGELEWMVGSWKDNTPGINVETRVEWTKNNHFLRRSFTVTREGEDPMEGTEVIGYDPVAGQIRSWMFDSEGGFGEGLWRQEGNKWLITAKATGPDGTTSTAQHVITKIDDKKITWESINRQSGGEMLPNLDKVEVIRTAGQ